LDGGGFAACTSPKSYTGLSGGSHTFQVRAKDGAGNVDASPASYTWTVDTTPPDTTITSNPSNPSSGSVSFSFSGTDSGTGVAGFECKLDGGSFAACTSPQNYSSLSDGSHTFQVRATDGVGNVDQTPASFTWLVDTTAPDTTITGTPPAVTGANTSFTFTGSDAGSGVASFECKLDGGSFAACTSPQSYTGLSAGGHTFQVRAIDAVGNVDATPASHTWTVVLNSPPTVSVARGGSCGGSGVTGTMNLTVFDADGDTLTITATSSNMTVVPNGNVVFGGSGVNRTVSITAVDKKSGFSDVTITVSDGMAPPVQVVIRVTVGTNQKDTVNGTSGADKIFGLNGDDTINAGAGIDLICGGNGAGTVNGGPGDDTIDGSTGNDILKGDDGDDILIGGQGNDRLEGGNNNDTMTGGQGADAFIGGAGSDTATDFTTSQGDTKDGTTEIAAAFPAFWGSDLFGGYLASGSLWGINPYPGAGSPLSYFMTGGGPVIAPEQ
jgi:Ca2+-binding RTX toxin-like protein